MGEMGVAIFAIVMVIGLLVALAVGRDFQKKNGDK